MRYLPPSVIAAIVLATGCGTVQPVDQATADQADVQIGSGEVTMPTSTAPVALGKYGMMYLFAGLMDGGIYGATEFNMCGFAEGFAMQWDPSLCDQAFGTYTAPDGQVALVTQFMYPSAIRGNAATPDAIMVDWESGDGNNLGEEGLNDGWYNVPMENGVPYTFLYTDCEHPHANIYAGWDRDGNIALPVDPGSLGEDYCDRSED